MTPRQSGHRPKRETQDIRASEVAELRSENQHLRRENARLRRELRRSPPIEVDEEGTMADKEPSSDTPKCPKCQSHNLIGLAMNDKNYTVCKDCKWRAQNL